MSIVHRTICDRCKIEGEGYQVERIGESGVWEPPYGWWSASAWQKSFSTAADTAPYYLRDNFTLCPACAKRALEPPAEGA